MGGPKYYTQVEAEIQPVTKLKKPKLYFQNINTDYLPIPSDTNFTQRPKLPHTFKKKQPVYYSNVNTYGTVGSNNPQSYNTWEDTPIPLAEPKIHLNVNQYKSMELST